MVRKFAGWLGESSSIISEHKYYRTLLLENLKDKDLVVFDIYIRIGHNIYLDMLDKDNLNEQYFLYNTRIEYKGISVWTSNRICRWYLFR